MNAVAKWEQLHEVVVEHQQRTIMSQQPQPQTTSDTMRNIPLPHSDDSTNENSQVSFICLKTCFPFFFLFFFFPQHFIELSLFPVYKRSFCHSATTSTAASTTATTTS